jgi:hypothetical protein
MWTIIHVYGFMQVLVEVYTLALKDITSHAIYCERYRINLLGECLSHAIFLFYRYPRRRSHSVAGHKLVHILLWDPVDVDAVPVPRKDISDILGILLLNAAEMWIKSSDSMQRNVHLDHTSSRSLTWPG